MTFEQIYKTRPDKKEVGSSGYSNMKHLYDYCMELEPEIIIESGVWKGNSSYLFRKALPRSTVICFDIDFSNLIWRCHSIDYFEYDIEESVFGELPDEDYVLFKYDVDEISDFIRFIVKDSILLFFDDHVNQEKRLKWLIKHKFRHAIFDDNIPSDKLHTVKNPASPTLEMLKEKGQLPELKQYKVLPNLADNKKNTYLTYIEL